LRFGVLALVIIWARYEATGFALGRKDRGIVSRELRKVHGVPRRTCDLDFHEADDLFVLFWLHDTSDIMLAYS